jgi:threonine dehydratase
MNKVTMSGLLAAQKMIKPYIWQTPLLPSTGLGARTGAQVYLKLECWQRTGSFKERGALTKLASLSAQEVARGVVTASAGNHGLGVAYACQALGLPPATIFVPESAPASKVNRLQTYDCELRRAGPDYDTCHAIADAHARATDSLYLSAYDDPVVIAGQGTAGLEVIQDLPDADAILVPVGGGGLIAGVAVVAKTVNPKIRVIGVQPEASPAAFLSFRDGRAYETYDAGPTICDGLAGGFGRVPFELAANLIDEILVVPEADVLRAVSWLVSHEQLIVEGAGAIAVAPLLNGQYWAPGARVVAVLTGRNLDPDVLQAILEKTEQGEAAEA